MRKMEYVPWILIFGVTSIIAFISVFFPVTQIFDIDQLGIEISGTAIGFALAISAAEIFKILEKRAQEKGTIKTLCNEIYNIIEHALGIENVYLPLQDDMWKMSISSGNLSLLNTDVRARFRAIYMLVNTFNEERKLWLMHSSVRNDEAIEYHKVILDATEREIIKHGCIVLDMFPSTTGAVITNTAVKT